MDLLGTLLNQFSEGDINKVGNQLGLSPDLAKSAMGSAIPILMNALAKNSSSPEGASALENALNTKHDGSILDNLGSFLGNPDLNDGDGILRHVLGDKRQNVEKYISEDSGVGSQVSGQLLKMLAPVVLGYLGRQNRSSEGGGGIGDLLGGFLNREKATSPQSQNVFEQLLDRNNDGSVVDDVANLGMSFLGRMMKR